MRARNAARPRRGLTLLEVLVALAILGLAAAGWATLFGQSMHAVRLMQSRDAEMRNATAQIARVSTWSRPQLAARVGRTNASGFLLIVGPITPSLYDVTIADTTHGAPLLRTSFYARDTSALAR